MALEMELNNLTRAELARKLGISRARVTQMLNHLKPPAELIKEIEGMGDYWGRRLMTERSQRRKQGFEENALLGRIGYQQKNKLLLGYREER